MLCTHRLYFFSCRTRTNPYTSQLLNPQLIIVPSISPPPLLLMKFMVDLKLFSILPFKTLGTKPLYEVANFTQDNAGSGKFNRRGSVRSNLSLTLKKQILRSISSAFPAYTQRKYWTMLLTNLWRLSFLVTVKFINSLTTYSLRSFVPRVIVSTICLDSVFCNNKPHNEQLRKFSRQAECCILFWIPNIYNLVDVLLGIQFETYAKTDSPSHNKPKKTVIKETYLLQQMAKYSRGEMTGFEFIQDVSFTFLAK